MDDFHSDAAEMGRQQEEARQANAREVIRRTASSMGVSEEVALYILRLETQVQELGGTLPGRP
jgi:hypothetical protein